MLVKSKEKSSKIANNGWLQSVYHQHNSAKGRSAWEVRGSAGTGG